MRIATYNVWYQDIDVRAEQLFEEIDKVDADVIALQEVPSAFYKELVKGCEYEHCAYVSYEDEEMGLAFLSKHPILNQINFIDDSISQSIILEREGIKYSITNVHLPWNSIIAKEKQIVAIDKFIHSCEKKLIFLFFLVILIARYLQVFIIIL